MTPDEARQVCARVRERFIRTKFTPGQADRFAADILPLPFAPVLTFVEVYGRHHDFAPTVADIWSGMIAAALALPTPEQAWAEVQERARAISPGVELPRWTAHPLVKAALRQVGGTWAVRTSDRPDLLRDRFTKVYVELRDRELGRLDALIDAGHAAFTVSLDGAPALELQPGAARLMLLA